jgi:4-amino-4-deoxy-L-arabinose transferase-like glycosyltransferase
MNPFITFFKKNHFLNTKIVIWLLVIYFPIFLNLGGLVMLRWDEGRYGVSSYEMLQNKNPFIVTFLNQPCLDSTKPPLMHWLQAISITLFGFNETSVRLPSALAGLIICIVIMSFSIKRFNSFSLGAICTLLLVTTPDGFCGIDHCVRSGDYDALLAMFSFIAILYFYQYNQQPQKHKYLFLTFVFFACAFLTKGVAALFYTPGLVIYAIIKGNFLSLLKSKWLYFSIAFFVFTIGFFLLMREYYSPGYLKALNETEILGRRDVVKDGHVGDAWYYFTFLKQRFDYFFLLIPFSWMLGMSHKDEKIRTFSVFSFVLSITFYLVISTSQTKIQWYAFPLLPLLALQAGILVWILLKGIVSYVTSKAQFNKVPLLYFSIILVFSSSYSKSVDNASERTFEEWYMSYNNIQEYLKPERQVQKKAILVATNNDVQIPYLFYYHKLNGDGFNLKYQLGYSNYYKAGDKLIVEDPAIQQVIERNYTFNVIDEFRHLKVYIITGKKN